MGCNLCAWRRETKRKKLKEKNQMNRKLELKTNECGNKLKKKDE